MFCLKQGSVTISLLKYFLMDQGNSVPGGSALGLVSVGAGCRTVQLLAGLCA